MSEDPSVAELGEVVESGWAGPLSQVGLEAVEAWGSGRWGECESLCALLLPALWERLNTGHWHDVDGAWRRLHSLASLLHARLLLRQDRHTEALKAADLGLLMGSPLLDPALTHLAHSIHNALPRYAAQAQDQYTQPKVPRRLPPLSPVHSIPRVELPSLERFAKEYLGPEKPVIITGLVSEWPACSKWSVEHIRAECGHRHVPVEVGSRYTDEGWGQEIMTLHEFCDRFMGEGEGQKGYLAQHELFTQVPALAADWTTPDYCLLPGDESEPAVNAWFGPLGTVSPLHQDPRANLLAQVFGSKYVRLYDARDSAAVYPHRDGILTNTSMVDVEDIDAARFPDILRLPFWECVLESGEALFIPRQWWHYLRSLQPSFSISFWFGPSV